MEARKTITITATFLILTSLAAASFGQITYNIEDITAGDLGQCADAWDQENDTNADGDNEIGCTFPLFNDPIEGNTWDTGFKEYTLRGLQIGGSRTDFSFNELVTSGTYDEDWNVTDGVEKSKACGTEDHYTVDVCNNPKNGKCKGGTTTEDRYDGDAIVANGDQSTRKATTDPFGAKEDITVTFTIGTGQSGNSQCNGPGQGSQQDIRFQYRENGGQWQTARTFSINSHNTDDETSLHGTRVSEQLGNNPGTLELRWIQDGLSSPGNSGMWAIDGIEMDFTEFGPDMVSMVYPSITMRGNEVKLRGNNEAESQDVEHHIEYFDNNGNEISDEVVEDGDVGVNQNLSRIMDYQSENLYYSAGNLTEVESSYRIPHYSYVHEVKFTDNVDSPNPSTFPDDLKRPIRRPTARSNPSNNVDDFSSAFITFAPHNININNEPSQGTTDYRRLRKGNSELDNNEDDDRITNNVLGDETMPNNNDNQHNVEVSWREDYGRPLIKYGPDAGKQTVDSPLNQDSYSCDDDDATASSGSGCSSCSSASGSVTTNRDSQNDNYYYTTSNDIITRSDCNEDGDEACATDYSGCCNKNCTCSSSQACWGDERGWYDNTYDCDQHSTVDGRKYLGKGNAPGATFTQYTAHQDDDWTPDSYPNSGNNQGGSAWCGWDPSRTLTVNADGPNGRGDGWIVVDESEGSGKDKVVARLGPTGDNMVGKNVHYRRGTSLVNDINNNNEISRRSTDFIEQADLDCDNKICLKYIDFYTDNEDWEWQGSVDDTIRDSIETRTDTYTLDQSYSVCKMTNRVYRLDSNNDMNSEIVTCDYKKPPYAGGDISGPDGLNEGGGQEFLSVSPLQEACGDEEDEYVFTMAGPEVNQNRLTGSVAGDNGYLNHHQKCVDIGSFGDQTVGGVDADEDSCLDKGRLYEEGTVKTIRRHTLDLDYDEFDNDDLKGDPNNWDMDRSYNNWAESPRNLDQSGSPARGPPVYETRGGLQTESPDWSVCLNIDADPLVNTGEDRGSEKTDVGGQWYDLDDPIVGEYLRENMYLVENQKRFDRHDIAYYWRRNYNPENQDWNPTGKTSGTALETNCGNDNHPEVSQSTECQDTDLQDGRVYNFMRESGGYKNFRDEVYP